MRGTACSFFLCQGQQTMLKQFFSLFLVILFFLPTDLLAATSPSLDQEAVDVIYSGQEIMHFSIAWSGGIKIGDLYLSVKPDEQGSGLVIKARVTDYGLFKVFYPVNDTFTTYIQGNLHLPIRYEVHQIEGGHIDTHRLTVYDQKKLSVTYVKNKEPEQVFSLSGIVYNEFSSFFITRALQLRHDKQEIVPTFVDKKRHEVAVKVFGKEEKNTMFGRVSTIKVMPKMDFKGLYDKDGDTVFWLTNNKCRIPVEIESKIMIGSLVAELVEYDNPVCTWTKLHQKHGVEN
jgi:hypothetical protein